MLVGPSVAHIDALLVVLMDEFLIPDGDIAAQPLVIERWGVVPGAGIGAEGM